MYQHRTYREKSNDFDKMCALVTYLNGEHLCDWSLGRMYGWKYGRWSAESQIDALFEKQAELFLDNTGELRGIVITDNMGSSYYLLSVKNEELLCCMVDFLLVGRNFDKSYVITVPENDEFQKAFLEGKGFMYCNDADCTYRYDVSDIVLHNIELPSGFTMTSKKEYQDEEAVEHYKFYAFNPDSVYDDVIDRAYKYSRTDPSDVPELDILILNEKGEPVSGCIGLWDKHNQFMEVEVVATKKEYENRGFAKAVISECIQRGINKGVKEFSISAWEEKTRKIYSSFGKAQAIKKVNYKKGAI